MRVQLPIFVACFQQLSAHFCAGGTSVQDPCATSAAMPMVSPSVGCGWLVLPISTAAAPISMATAGSPIVSPRVGTDHAAGQDLDGGAGQHGRLLTLLRVQSSNSSLVTPSSRPLAMARPEAFQGYRPLRTLMPCAQGTESAVRPTQATSGSDVGHAGDDAVCDGHTGRADGDLLAVGAAAPGLQDQVIHPRCGTPKCAVGCRPQ